MDMKSPAAANTDRKNRGCGNLKPQNLCIVQKNADGNEFSLSLDKNQQVVLTEGPSGTTFIVGLAKPGMITLGLTSDLGIEAVDGCLRVTKETKTPFVIESVPGDDHNLYRLRTEEGLYLSAQEPGRQICLTSEPGADTALRFTAAPDSDRGIHSMFAAEEGAWDNEKLSTHLWIFNRAISLIRNTDNNNEFAINPKLSENLDVLRHCLNDKEFVDSVKHGIDAADNSGLLDKDTSGFIYSAHFYNPESKRGGYWDPDPNINALNYGKGYFHKSIDADSIQHSGINLGLAIHYLQDLCQPMHCGLFPNIPPAVAAAYFLDPLLVQDALVYGYKHDMYEKWILAIQDRPYLQNPCFLQRHELKLNEFNFEDDGRWWEFAAEVGLSEFKAWRILADSPINSQPSVLTEPTVEEAAHAGKESWVPSTSKMLKLAQRLVVGLMLTWAAKPAKVLSDMKPTYEKSELLIVSGGRCIVAGDTDDNNVYHQPSRGRPNARWILEPVLNNGKPTFLFENDKQNPVYYIKDKKHNKYIVAGDIQDGHIYHQAHDNRLNAQWIFEPVLGPDGKPSSLVIGHPYDMYHPLEEPNVYPLYYLRDMKHRLCIVAGTDVNDERLYHNKGDGLDNAQWALSSELNY